MDLKYRKPPSLAGYNYPLKAAKRIRTEGRLLSLRVETSTACNLHCIYCNGDSGRKLPREIPFLLIKDVILQAKDLGARSVVVIGGGEPTVYPHFKALVRFIAKQDLVPVVFTNAQLLSPCMCRFLFDENASVLFKLDSFNETIQDRLCGKPGAFKNIVQGVENLLAADFNTNGNGQLRCGASFVATRLNYQEIPALWRFCRENNLYPNLEQLVPRNRGLQNLSDLLLSREQLQEIKTKLLSLDRKEYGFNWLAYSPLCGHGCWQPLYSMYLTSSGYVQPCADIAVKLHSAKDLLLREIIETPFFQLARNIDKKITGRCRTCRHKASCIGCRGIAFTHGQSMGLTPEEALCLEDPSCPLTESLLDS